MSDDWILKRAAKDREKDEEAERAATNDRQREQGRIKAVNEQLPGLWKQLVSALERKVKLYNEHRGKPLLAVVSTTSDAAAESRRIVVERTDERRRSYVIDCDWANGTLTSSLTTSGRTGGRNEGSGSIIMTSDGDEVAFGFVGRGRADVEAVSDEVLEKLLEG